MWQTSLSFVSNSAQILFFLIGIFYAFLSLRGFRGVPPPPPRSSKKLRFALILPAYNEEKVIKFSTESLLKINYPRELFDVFVVTDHCTDATENIAKGLGACILNHSGPDRRAGKGRALKWAVSEILKNGCYDGFCYFDADSLAHPDFLTVMNDHLSMGEEAIQGRQLTKNEDVWLSTILASSQILMNRLLQIPKYISGLSATLHGKGMCFSKRITEKFSWDETCLTEDIEMQMRLIRHGVRITWAEGAVVYNEEPVTVKQYLKRNIRWTRGSMVVAKRHFNGLLMRMLKQRDLKAFEGVLYCGGVYKLIAMIIFTSILLLLTTDPFIFYFWLYRKMPGADFGEKALAMLPLFFYPVPALAAERANFKLYIGYFLTPVLGILRFPVLFGGLLRRDAVWGRTEHSSQVGIADLVQEPQRVF